MPDFSLAQFVQAICYVHQIRSKINIFFGVGRGSTGDGLGGALERLRFSMTDRTMLTALLTCGRLTEDEERVFRGMLEKIDNGKPGSLSIRQRQWAMSVHERLNIVVAEKLAAEPQRPSVHPYETQPRPRKPPGRKCPEGVGFCKLCGTCRV